VVARRRRLIVPSRVFLLLVGIALVIAALRLWGPAATARRQQQDLDRLRVDKAALQNENAQLQEYQRKQASEGGRESAARREGYVREGERRLVFVKEKEKKPPDRKGSPADR
jgi:hypothetical protein